MKRYYLTITVKEIRDFMGANVDEFISNLQGLANFYNDYLSNKGLNLDISLSSDNDIDLKSNLSSYEAISDAKRIIDAYDRGLSTVNILQQSY
jgi:hypothetical protein